MGYLKKCPKCNSILTPICAGYVCNKCQLVINCEGVIIKEDGANFYAKPADVLRSYDLYLKTKGE